MKKTEDRVVLEIPPGSKIRYTITCTLEVDPLDESDSTAVQEVLEACRGYGSGEITGIAVVRKEE